MAPMAFYLNRRHARSQALATVLALLLTTTLASELWAGDIWLHMLTTGQPAASKYLGDTLGGGGNWFVNFEVGQSSWFATDVGVGTNASADDASWNWGEATWYEDGSGSNKRVRRDLGTFKFTATGNWYFNGRAKDVSGDPWHYANNDAWGNSSSFAPIYYFSVSALNNPSGQTSTTNATNPSTEVILSWSKDAQSHDVMIVRKTSAQSWTEPTQGSTYSAGNSIGSGVVTYKGSATSYTNTGLSAETTYDYKFYSVNADYYSPGVTSTVTTAASPPPPALMASPSTLTFSSYQGSFPASQSFTVTNTGGTLLYYTNTLTYAPGASNWLSVTPSNQSVAAGAWWTNSASVIVSNLAPGTYTATNTLTGNQTNGTQSVTISLTVQSPVNPGSLSVVTNSTHTATRLDVGWAKNAQGNDVMVVRSTDPTFFTPANGTLYSAGYTSGNDEVIYKGGGTSLTDSNRLPNTTYYYRFFSENWTFYSTGADATGRTAMVQARNTSGGTPEKPASVYLGDTNLTFGLDSWGMIEANWGKARVAIHTNADVANGAIGAYSSYVNVEHKTASSLQFTSTGTWYWGIQMEYGSYGAGFWYATNTTTWTDMTPSPNSSLTLTVNPLPDSSPVSAVTNSLSPTNKIDLAWTRPGTYNVMIVRRQGADPEAPANGTTYSLNQTYGTGGGNQVIYAAGSGSTLTDTGLVANTTYHYGFFTENNHYYSPGVFTNATTAALPTQPVLGYGPSSLIFSAYRGGTPPSQTFFVTNTGGGTLYYTNTLSWSAGASGWLAVTPADTNLSMGASCANAISVIASNLEPATYTATNTLGGNQDNGTPIVAIAFTVNELPSPTGVNASAINPRSVTLNWTRAGSFDVMVVRRQGALPEAPAQGTAYSHDATYGIGNQVIYAHGSGTSDTDTGVLPQTVYYYAFYSENYSRYSPAATLCVTTLAARVDGVADEWMGILPAAVNSSTISSNEFMWRDKEYEERTDPENEANADISEFRVRADSSNVYFYVKFQDITDVALPYIAVGVDTDQSPTDDGMNWLGDQSGVLLGGGYASNGLAPLHYSERNMIIHNVSGTGPVIELNAGSSWYAPPTLGQGSNYVNATDNFIEWAVARSDLGLEGSVTARFTVASFLNAGGWANDGDTTLNLSTCDALDTLSIAPAGASDAAGSLSAWDEELSDGDVDFFFDVRLDAAGLAPNQVPNAPGVASLFPGTNSVIEPGSFTCSWDASTDPDGTVSGYFVELSTNSLFNGGENLSISYRGNTAPTNRTFIVESPVATQYYWRVRSRDLGGALSGYTTATFQLGGTDDDTVGPQPSLVFIGANFTPGQTQTNITDADLANTNNLVDIAVQWTDPSGVFMTNGASQANNNILDWNGRVIPNWDLYTTNRLSGVEKSFGYDQPFSEFYGHNGDTTVTTVYHNAFSVTNIDTNNIFFLTVSAEDEDNDRGTYPDPQGDGDAVPWDRAITVNAQVQFYVTDDDSAGPVFSGFNVDGTSFINSTLTEGLVVTGLVQDIGSGVAGNSNRYVLYRGNVEVANGAFTTQPATDGAAKTTPEPVSITFPAAIVGYTGTYRLVTSGWDVDNDKLNDRAQGTNEFVFNVVPPPVYSYTMPITLNYDRSETLTNFPALVVLNSSVPGFRYDQFASRQGYDLRFSDAEGHAWLNYEIEKWDTNGNSYVWVQVPRLSAATNTIRAYWGGTSETNPVASTTNGTTWTEHYRGVFHLQATSGTIAVDATTHAAHGTLANPGDVNWSPGLIGNGLTFNGVNGYVSNTLAASWTGPYSVTFWAKASSTGQPAGLGLFNTGGNGFQVETDGSVPGAYQYAGSSAVGLGTVTTNWVFVAITCDGVTTKTYYNGLYAGSASEVRDSFIRYDIGTGTNRSAMFQGLIDELQIAESARSSNWVWAMWLNVSSNTTFSSFGTLQRKGTFFQIDADSTTGGVNLPLTESFETLSPGTLDGQSNWNASAGATVQSNVVFSGTRAARLANGYAWHGLQPASGTNVWVDWYAWPIRRDASPLDIADVNVNASAAFYVDGNGHVVARSNETWVTFPSTTIPSNTWTRFTVHLDYINHTWSLHVADSTPNALVTNVTANLPFHATNVNALVSFRMTEEAATGYSYLDNLAMGSVAPLAVDEDHNGLPDTWERAYFTTNGVSPDADSDGDGISNLRERLAGTNPTNSQSLLKIVGMDLSSATSSGVVVRILGGGHEGGSPYTNTGDRAVRTFVVQRAVNDVSLPKVAITGVVDSATGTNTWTDPDAAATEGSRYYNIAVTLAGSGYTNTEEWAAHTQTRTLGGQYLITVPVDYGSAAANNLNSTLGQQLALGLHAGTEASNADRIQRWNDSGTWDQYYLFSSGGGVYWSPDLDGATTANVQVAVGTAFWVVRGSNSAARGNTVFTGHSFTPQAVADMTFKTNSGGWTMFGWPLPQPGRHQNLGAATPANQLGFSTIGRGASQWDPVAYPNQVGDQIWVWKDNTWKHWYWLVTGIGPAYDGRWWDNSSTATGVWKFADFSLEVGKAYYYWHPANGGATNFLWHPTLP